MKADSSVSFAFSGCLHGCVLAYVIWGGAGQAMPRAQSIYDQEIRPNEKKIIWYSLREKLPEIGAAGAEGEAPPRARFHAPQTMVSGARDEAHPAPLIWAPEPEVAAPKDVPLPNVVAVAAPKLVRPFLAPPVKVAEPSATPSLADAPEAKPAEVKALPPQTVMPRGPVRAFTPPPKVRMERQAMLPLPEGPRPEMVVEANALPVPTAGPRPEPRPFVPPPVKPRVQSAAALPAAPEVADFSAPRAGLEKVPRGYLPRRLPAPPVVTPTISAEPPSAAEAPAATAEASMAIVGLNPANTVNVPAPPASRAAGFSAGPEPREGGAGSNRTALVNVPGLVVKGGAKDTQPTLVARFTPATSRENLLAAARMAAAAPPKLPVEPSAPRVAEAPDARFAGRAVYAIAIQMPNVTSFSGSWLVWFAEREPAPGVARQMKPPEVVRKVDPKYIAAAAAERVEGTVRLFAVIGRDGRVGGIAVLRNLDARLDRSAQEALAKWEFTPALRDGVAVDVEAIFEIPFHLAPRPKL